MAHPDPYASYLSQARALFAGGEVLKAGQIWQAILKKDPSHAEAKQGLYRVRLWLEAQQVPPAPAAPPPPPPPPPVLSAPPPAPPPPADPPEAGAEEESALPPLQSINLEAHVPEAVPKAIKRTQRSVGGAPPPSEAEPGPPTAPEAAPVLPLPEEGEEERFIREGCTLYDMGEVQGAIQKWEAVLSRHPGHEMARGYLNQARRELGLPPLPGVAPTSHAWGTVEAGRPAGDPDQLLREAVQLEEMGLPEEAVEKLKRVLEIDPDHRDAKAYLEMHARTQGGAPMVAPPPPPRQAPAPVPAPSVPLPAEDFKDFTPSTLPPLAPEPLPAPTLPPAPADGAPAAAPKAPATPPAVPGPAAPGLRRMDATALEQKVRQGERLLRIRHFEEAIFAFQMVLMQEPGHPRAKAGLEQAQAGLAGPPEPAPLDREAGAAVQPPLAVTSAAPPVRTGPEMAALLKDVAWWKRNPLALGLAGGFLLGTLLAVWQHQQKEVRLQRAVEDARRAVMTPRSSAARPVDLKESPASVRSECESALQDDPVRAYHRALYMLKLDPSDPLGAQLRERAKAALASPPAATAAELNTQLQAGDLEAAAQTVTRLLQANPEDPALMAKAARIHGALAQAYAARENWTEARESLRRCRALFPEDPAWQGRLRLMDALQAMPKGERAAWVAMLG